MSTIANAAEKGLIAEAVLLPGDPMRAKFIAENFLAGPVLYNQIRGMLGYTGTYKGVPVSVQSTGMGMPSMGIYSWELMEYYGVQRLIRTGTAGSFAEELKMGDLLVALAASTDSNYGVTFELPGTLAPCCNYALLKKAQRAADDMNVNLRGGNVVSTDILYDQRKDWWKKWKQMGVMAVEMETAALYMNAAFHGRQALALLTISDHFLSDERASLSERETAYTDMMKVALETVSA